MIGLSLLLAAAAPCVGPVCNFDTLKPWFERITDEAWLKSPARSAHILQIGDSHTAGDALTGGWRTLLQAPWIGTVWTEYGSRGVLPPGRPYDGYFTQGVTVTMSDGWQVATTFGKGSAMPRPPLGLSSYTLTSTRPGASMALSAAPGMEFIRFTLCGLAGPGAGRVVVRFHGVGGEDEETFDFSRKTSGPLCMETPEDDDPGRGFVLPKSKVELSVQGGPVTLTSWGFFSEAGITLSNLGVVGSQLQHFGRTDDAVLAEELRAYGPNLIVLAFGTNEGFAPSIDAAAYEATLRAQIARIQRLAPDVPILLLGPPDALSRNEALRGGAANCPVVPGIAPLFAPPGLAQVRAVQRKVAGDLHLAWWDWQARMGGLCSAQRWVGQGLMRGDYVHFRSEGGARIARLLQDDLDRAEREAR